MIIYHKESEIHRGNKPNQRFPNNPLCISVMKPII